MARLERQRELPGALAADFVPVKTSCWARGALGCVRAGRRAPRAASCFCLGASKRAPRAPGRSGRVQELRRLRSAARVNVRCRRLFASCCQPVFVCTRGALAVLVWWLWLVDRPGCATLGGAGGGVSGRSGGDSGRRRVAACGAPGSRARAACAAAAWLCVVAGVEAVVRVRGARRTQSTLACSGFVPGRALPLWPN